MSSPLFSYHFHKQFLNFQKSGLIFLLLFFLLMGCQTSQQLVSGNQNLGVQGIRMVRTELIFGLSLNNGKFISAEEWEKFVNETLSPRFKEGLTIIDAQGQWMLADGGIVKEPSKMVVLFYKPTDDKEPLIRECIATYKERFAQEAVLRADYLVSVSF
jgi:hypothetical protein